MRFDRRFLGWGVFLIAVGAVPLAMRAGVIATGFDWGGLWPLLVVGVGLGFVLRATPAEPLGGLLVALTLGLLVGGAIGGASFAVGCGSGNRPFPAQSGTFGAQRASVTIELGCGELEVATIAGQAWSLSGTTDSGNTPRVSNAADRLEIRPERDGAFGFLGEGGQLNVGLPQSTTIDLETTVNAGRAHLDLAGADVAAASLTVNAGDVRLDLSGTHLASLTSTINAGSAKIALPAGTLSGSVTVNAGSLSVCVPAGAGVRIQTGGGALGSYQFSAAGLQQSGSTWQTPGFDAAATRIDLSATANAGSITLNPSEGCR